MPSIRSFAALAALSAAVFVCENAHADGDDGHRLKWEYPRFRKTEIAAATAISFGDLMIEYVWQSTPEHDYNSVGPFDRPMRNAFAASTIEGRGRAAAISDVMWHSTQYLPVVLDGLILPLVTDGLNYDVALQITALNWQAEGLAFFFTRFAHRSVGRARPNQLSCAGDTKYDPGGNCAADAKPGDTHVSFISGHTAMSFSGAGLVCSHHLHLDLFGSKPADIGICAVALASATTVGFLRIVADKHWTTDVLTGVVVGLGTGMLMPYLLHYQQKLPGNSEHVSWALAPMVLAEGGGAAAMGAF